jgi:hypothetical protein
VDSLKVEKDPGYQEERKTPAMRRKWWWLLLGISKRFPSLQDYI